MKRWEIFCRIVDYLGDAGVCWRLSRQLAQEKGLQVRLWIDDLGALAKIWPQIDPDRSLQYCAGVEIALWPDIFLDSWPAPADVVIEAFACELPPQHIAAMRAKQIKPLWLNLEYLSAEPWIESCHGLPSPQQGNQKGLKKYFFFPGFSERTGGLIRETEMSHQRAAWSETDRVRWLSHHGIVPAPGALLISVFTYENPALLDLLSIWASGDTPVHVLFTKVAVPSSVVGQIEKNKKQNTVDLFRKANVLRLTVLPMLSQKDYDYLLWCCDLNFIRGEDSFVRAQWAARPFIWHIYPQKNGVHLVKLNAFLDRYLHNICPAATQDIRHFWLIWNGEKVQGGIESAWKRFAVYLPLLRQYAHQWAHRLEKNQDLATHLVNFVEQKSHIG